MLSHLLNVLTLVFAAFCPKDTRAKRYGGRYGYVASSGTKQWVDASRDCHFNYGGQLPIVKDLDFKNELLNAEDDLWGEYIFCEKKT